jgi:hypothetical protein
MWSAWRLPLQNIELMTQYDELRFQLLSRPEAVTQLRTNRKPIAIIWRSCSDSPMTASQTDEVFGSDSPFEFDEMAGCESASNFRRFTPMGSRPV